MNNTYLDAVVENPKTWDLGNDMYAVEFWKPEFCEALINIAENIEGGFQSQPGDPVYGQEIRISRISDLFYLNYCQHWKRVISPFLEQKIGLPSDQWFVGWKVPFIIKYTMEGQRGLRPHADDSLYTGTIKLSHGYSGGELIYPRQQFTNKDTPVGTMILAPSAITHVHYSSELQSGTKYSFVSWTKLNKSDSGINYSEVQ